MEDTEHLAINQLDASDAAGGLRLSAEAHWNQTEDDWRFFLTKGIVFGTRDRKGNLVATAALLPYTERDAWISMVLVTESFRRRGLATRLVDTCLNTATKLGFTSWLDATPAGAQVYGPLGFTPTIQLRRLRLAKPTASGNAASPPAGKIDEFLICDISAMGFSRRELLEELSRRSLRAFSRLPTPWRWSATAAPRDMSGRCLPSIQRMRLRWYATSPPARAVRC